MKVTTKYLLNDKAQHTENLYSRELQCKDNLLYEVYENAYILPYKTGGYGGVLTGEGEHVNLSIGPVLESKVYEIKDERKEDFTVVYGGPYIGHFGHFLTDTNLRSWIALNPIWETVDYIIFTRATKLEKIKQNCKEFWELLGIWDKVRFLDEPVQFTKVIVPECGYWNGKYYSKEWLKMFLKITDAAVAIGKKNNWKKYDKIFLSRRKFARKELGHSDIDRFWRKNGYKILYPEKYSLKKLLWILYGTKKIAGISGTIMHHLLFCSSDKEVYICERYYPINELQIDINMIKNVNVTYIDSNICIFPTYIGNTAAIVCYNEKFNSFANDYHMKKIKLLQNQPFKYRRYLKKYCYEWGKDGKINVNEDYLIERNESYAEARKTYGWLDMRPGSGIYRLVKKVLGMEK